MTPHPLLPPPLATNRPDTPIITFRGIGHRDYHHRPEKAVDAIVNVARLEEATGASYKYALPPDGTNTKTQRRKITGGSFLFNCPSSAGTDQ